MDENKKNKKRISKGTDEYRDLYMDYFQERHKPVSEAFIQNLAFEILEEAKNPNTLRIAQILRKYPWSRTQIYKWMEHHEFLKTAWDTARMYMSDNREKKAQEDPRYLTLYTRNQLVYDYDYRDAVKWREDIKPAKNANDGNANITVVMNPSESHPSVPDVRVNTEPYELNDESGE